MKALIDKIDGLSSELVGLISEAKAIMRCVLHTISDIDTYWNE